MLDNDNITFANVSEAVEKVPTDEKSYRKFSFMCFSFYSHSIQHSNITKFNTRKSCFPTRIHPV